MTRAVRRLLCLLPVTRPHTGKHRPRARDVAAAARPAAPHYAGQLMNGPVSAVTSPAGTGTAPLPRRVPGASLAATPLPTDRTPGYGEHQSQLAVAEAQRLEEAMQP